MKFLWSIEQSQNYARTPEKSHCAWRPLGPKNTNRSLLFREKTSLYCENNRKHVGLNTVYVLNVELFNIEADGKYSYRRTLER